tara:strand:- start:5267 stop:5836 length:570 start_codon:yes stop_codon:yes gene_type:complete
MVLLDATLAPSLFTRLSQPLRDLQRRVRRRSGKLDVALGDFVGEAIKPGDKVLQIGASDIATYAFLKQGAFHHLVAPTSAAEIVESGCAAMGVDATRLRVFSSAGTSESAGTVDAVFLAHAAGFAALAAHMRHATGRLKTGGLLLVDGVDTFEGRRLYDALLADLGWRIDEVISGRVAVFRKTAGFQTG